MERFQTHIMNRIDTTIPLRSVWIGALTRQAHVCRARDSRIRTRVFSYGALTCQDTAIDVSARR